MSFALVLIYCNLATFALALWTIIHTARLRKMNSIRWLLALTICFVVGSFSSVNIFMAENFADKVLFFYLRALGTIFVAPCWLYFLSGVFDRWKWLHKKWVIAIIVAPCAVNFLLALFPATRPLLFTDFQALNYRGISVVQFKLGAWYNLFFLWSMALMLLSYIISVIAFSQEQGYRRRQVLILNMGFAAGLASYFLPQSQTLGWISGSSFSILFTQLGIVYAVVWHRLLSVVPLAMIPIFQKLPDPALVLDDRKRLMAANDKAIKFFDLPKNFLGQPLEKILPLVPLTPGEVLLAGKNQRPHHFHLALEKIGGDTDSSPGSVVYFRDIGEQKITELRLHEGLDFRARLLALLAHDLTGFVENQSLISLALQKSADPAHREQFELLSSSAQASQELVSNVMSWAKSQPMEFQPDKRSFEWNMLLQETIEQMQSRLTVNGIELVFSSAQNPLVGEGDSEMLASVFRNILSNAIRAIAKANGKKIYVSLRTRDKNVEVKVRDEGAGMDSKKLAEVLANSKEFLLAGMPKTHGSGIGLMITRHFLALHQGSFQIDSTLGAGTEVSFSLPL